MAHYYADIKAAIVAYIGTATKVRNIYDYEETKPAGYPAIIVVPSDGVGTFLDTVRIRRDFQFTIKVFQERVQVEPAEAERIITALVDELIPIFEGAGVTNLSNTVEFTQPPSTHWGYLQVPDADVRMCEITLVGVAAQ